MDRTQPVLISAEDAAVAPVTPDDDRFSGLSSLSSSPSHNGDVDDEATRASKRVRAAAAAAKRSLFGDKSVVDITEAGEEDEEEENLNEEEEIVGPYAWIIPGKTCMVTCGVNGAHFSDAAISSSPKWKPKKRKSTRKQAPRSKTVERGINDDDDGRWVVDIVWKWDNKLEQDVDCSRVQFVPAARTRRSRTTQNAVSHTAASNSNMKKPAKMVATKDPAKRRLHDEDEDRKPASKRVASTEKTMTRDNVGESGDEDEDEEMIASPNKLQRLFMERVEELLEFDITPTEARAGLRAVGYPYELQEAMAHIHESRNRAKAERTLFDIVPDQTRIRKCFTGTWHEGVVTKENEEPVLDESTGRHVRTWKVVYGDGDSEDMEWHEIAQNLIPPDIEPPPCLGRTMHCLELFCGQAVVSQAFVQQRGWKAESIDIDRNSNATICKDLLEFDPSRDLQHVPDFIWASPMCQTHSLMAAGKHRKNARGQYSITPTAVLHDRIFAKMVGIMRWAKEKKHHVIIVVENPNGQMKNMPLTREMAVNLGLQQKPTEVHYCAFGRDEKKPTHLWTNDTGLINQLSGFTCGNRCRVGKQHTSVRGNGQYDFAVIPEPLAALVARFVNARFVTNNIPYTPDVPV